MKALEAQPRCPLGFWPTPLHPLDRLSAEIGGPRIWIKRDDLSGLAFGGNKTRKLEFLVGGARQLGCDTLITGGAAQSNHCRQTAAAAAQLGLECHLALGGEAPKQVTGNLLLDELFGARIHWCGEQRKGEMIPQIEAELRAQGRNPGVIPYGGSNAIGALGFVAAFAEFTAQTRALDQSMDGIVFASSSGGTHAGLLLGARLADWSGRLLGIEIDKGLSNGKPFAEWIAELANTSASLLAVEMDFTAADPILCRDYAGPGYGVVSSLEREAIRLLAEREGILLDPVYTARAFGGMLDQIRRGVFAATDNILFWHTGGGPALFTGETIFK